MLRWVFYKQDMLPYERIPAWLKLNAMAGMRVCGGESSRAFACMSGGLIHNLSTVFITI